MWSGELCAETSQRIAWQGEQWALLVDLPGFKKEIDGVKPDGRRYFFATNEETGVNVSVTLEKVTKPATQKGCRDFLKRIVESNASIARDIRFWNSKGKSLATYRHGPVRGLDLRQRFYRACIPHENTYVDINLSKVNYKDADEVLFTKILDTVRIE